MKITGIICEYNPLHNGHILHIHRTHENGATHIVAVMSGNFVQRGETAVMDKFSRAALAVRAGADLVIELPAVRSLSSAEFFAGGAVSLLDSLGCIDELSFGSECGDISLLDRTADIMNELPVDLITEKMRSGMSYPVALYEYILQNYGDNIAKIVSSPNNILAVEYIKAIKRLGSGIRTFTVRRIGATHDSKECCDNIASASDIREKMEKHLIFNKFVPDFTSAEYEKCRRLGKLSDLKRLERIILYKLRTISADELAAVPDSEHGLAYRLKRSAASGTLRELLEAVGTKRYTTARIKRILLNMLIGTTADDLKITPPYARILAIGERGSQILSECKKTSRIPVSTSLAKLARTGKNAGRIAFLEGIASDVYGLSQKNAGSGEDDFRAAIRIDKK